MTYEYVCTSCSFAWEAEQSISEAPLKTCPSCKAETAKRQVTGGQGFILKGGGWYADGYGAKKPGAAETKSSTPSTSTGTTSTDTKSETKSETAKPTPSDKSGA